MIPIATHTISVVRKTAEQIVTDSDPYGEGYPDSDPATPEGVKKASESRVAVGVRAVIAATSGYERLVGGDTTGVSYKLTCDPCDLTHLDVVVDEKTGVRYNVVWASENSDPFGLSHMDASLNIVQGLAP